METPPSRNQADLINAFWERVLEAGAVDDLCAQSPVDFGTFGDSAELADELVELVVKGSKRATTSAFAEYVEGETLPRPGTISIVTDASGRPRAVVRTTQVRVGPLSSVDESFAFDEGEGDRTRASWWTAHQQFFERHLPTIGATFDPEMKAVFERFEVLYSE